MNMIAMKESKYLKYLTIGDNDPLWGVTVSSIGYQSVQSHEFYPPDSYPKNHAFSPERGRILNDEYQLIYITKGRGTFRSKSSGLKEMSLQEGSMFLLFPGEWHNYMPDQETGWNEYWIGFKGEAINHRVENGFFDKSSPILNVGTNDQIVALYQQAIRIAEWQKKGFQQLLAGYVHMLLGLAYSLGRNCDTDGEEREVQLVEKAKMIMQDDYLEIKPQTVADMLNISYSSFRKLFKQYTGYAPAQYIGELKNQQSKELLAHTFIPIKEVAYNTGFENQEYFFISFKKKNGLTPLEYRKAYGTAQ